MSKNKNNKKSSQNFVKELHNLDIKYKNKIIWEKIEIAPYIKYVDSIDVYFDITNTTDINITDYKSHKIIGYCEMNCHLSFVNDTNELLYLITDEKYTVLYVSVGRTHPIFWYKVSSRENFINHFDQIYEMYNQKEYHLNHNSKTRAFIGTDAILSLETFDIENHLLMHKYSEKLLWGSKWPDHPYRINYMNESLSPFDSLVYTSHAMQQDYREDTYSISVRSKYSKSIITIYYHEDAYIAEIMYDKIETPQNEIINKTFGRFYNLDLPVDVIMLIFNFPFMQYQNIISMEPITHFHFYIINLLVSDDRAFLKQIEPDLKNILDKQPDMEDNLKAEIKDLIIYINDLKIFEKIVEEINILREEHIEIKIEDILEKYNCQENDYIKKCLDYYIK